MLLIPLLLPWVNHVESITTLSLLSHIQIVLFLRTINNIVWFKSKESLLFSSRVRIFLEWLIIMLCITFFFITHHLLSQVVYEKRPRHLLNIYIYVMNDLSRFLLFQFNERFNQSWFYTFSNILLSFCFVIYMPRVSYFLNKHMFFVLAL